MKPTLKVFFLLLMPIFARAQEDLYYKTWSDKEADSLKRQIAVTQNDSTRMFIYRCLGVHYQEVNRDSSYYFHEQQLVLARKLKMDLWHADALDQAGWCLASLKNYPKSLEYLSEAVTILKSADCERNIWMISIFSKDKIPRYARLKCLGFCYNDISQLYLAAGNPEKELAALHQGLRVGEEINNRSIIGLISANLSGAYLENGKLDSSLYYGDKGLYNMRISGYDTYRGYLYKLIGKVYLKEKQYTKAKTYFDSAITSTVKINSFTQLPDTYLAIAELYKQQGKLDSAILYAAKITSSNYSDAKKIYEAYNALYELYVQASDKDSAYHYLQLSKALGDSLNTDERKLLNAYQNIGFTQQIKAKEKEAELMHKANAIRFYALVGGIAVLIVIILLLFRNSKNRKKANNQLQKQKEEIEVQKKNVEKTLSELKSAQSQLIQSEKMASLGELTAGIAHEIQNPLNFVNNFSEVSNELIDEMVEEVDKGNIGEVKAIASDLKQNLEKINHHGKRADAIVKGMLQHSRTSSSAKEPTDINKLADEYLRLAYHGLRAKDKSFNATLKTDYDDTIGNINIIPQDIGRVILNLITNAFYVVKEKNLSGASAPTAVKYEPTVSVITKRIDSNVEISVTDNGAGIPKNILDKIFQPFFTTKPTGQGTGLGLSLAYDIVKAHGGELKVASKEGHGTTFIIQLPV